MNPRDIDLDNPLKRLHLPTMRRLWAPPAVHAAAESWARRDHLALLAAEELAHRNDTPIQ